MTKFGRLVDSLTHRKKPPKNPKGLAAYIGRKKYGKAKFEAMGRAGRRRKHK